MPEPLYQRQFFCCELSTRTSTSFWPIFTYGVTFLDQDDAFVETALERQLAALESTGCDVAVSAIHEFSTEDSLPQLPVGTGEVKVISSPLEDFFVKGGNGCAGVRVWGKLYRRSAIAGLLFPDGVYGADDFAKKRSGQARKLTTQCQKHENNLLIH